MYIEPNTIIRIIKGCPLDPSYENTLWWNNASEREAYFARKTKYTLDRQTYQRVQKNTMRVQVKAEDLYDCNYIGFQNSAFGNKWFYAFIKGVEYVNNITSEITFEMDVMQTWFFDYHLKNCFVEREHTETDEVGENLVPENLELGDYVNGDWSWSGWLQALSVVVGTTFGTAFDDFDGAIWSGIYSGLHYRAFSMDSPEEMETLRRWINGITVHRKIDGLVTAFLMPTCFVTDASFQNTQPITRSVQIAKNTSGLIGGHIVRNNKLYTYPYNFLYVTNLQGNSAEFPYEYFSTDVCNFSLVGDESPNPSVALYPRDYKGIGRNYDEKMLLSGYPQVAINVDAFKAWLAQNASSLAISGLSAATGAGMGYSAYNAKASADFSNNPIGQKLLQLSGMGTAISSGIAVANIVKQVGLAASMPDQAHGSQSGSLACADDHQDFLFINKHIRGEFAAIIDDYFDMYGYACHRVKTPNTHSRPEWNYVKTAYCDVEGITGLPADDAAKIINIHNTGITYWKNPDHVGNYQLNNKPV